MQRNLQHMYVGNVNITTCFATGNAQLSSTSAFGLDLGINVPALFSNAINQES